MGITTNTPNPTGCVEMISIGQATDIMSSINVIMEIIFKALALFICKLTISL